MKKYYTDPNSDNLIVYDDETGHLSVCERLRNVRVFTSQGNTYMTHGLENSDEQSAIVGQGRTKQGKPRMCGACGQPGHQRRTCPN